MKDYVQVPTAELEKPYEFTSPGESSTCLYLSRSSDFCLTCSCHVYKYSILLFRTIASVIFIGTLFFDYTLPFI